MKSLCLILLPYAVIGCVRYRAEPLDPAAELAGLRNADVESVMALRVAPGQDTRPRGKSFDPSDGLDEAELVAVALTLNPELRVHRARTGEAAAALITAGLWPNPELSLSPKWGLSGANGLAIEADALLQLLRPGQRQSHKNIASARVDQARHDAIAEEFRLVGEVRSSRLKVLAAERTAALLNEGVTLRQRLLDLVQRQRAAGEVTELDVAAAELEVAEARRDLRNVQAELSAALLELNRLLGLPPGYPVKLAGFGEPLTVPLYDDLSDDELDRRLLAGRVELPALQAAYRTAEEELRLAVLRQYPDLKLGPAVEKDTDDSWALGLALALEVPLLNQNQGEIAEKQAARQRVRAEYVALLAKLRADAFAARAGARRAKSEVEAQEREILPLLRRTQELFEGAYRARELKVIEWITAQQRALHSRREHLDASVRYRKAVIQLETSLGAELSRPATQPNPNQPNAGGSHVR